ncbi:STAM-binding -like A [Paramuricea clavata]|uniref:STAM-binding -like A n=1 Tax=Paramuricea clavata TaxID=317549 RepID=A0A6S7G208_PARCT|nr:STAM-binding -like A [Paramuricea clavata]
MEKMANVYLEEMNLEHAYILYTKLITLLIEKLPHHSQYKQITPLNRAEAKKRVTRAFKRAEELKEILRKKYGEELEIWKVKEFERIKLEEEEREKAKLRQQEKEHAEQQELERQKQLEQQRRDENEQQFLVLTELRSQSQHAFYISHLVIPKQTSTSDSCTTLSEEDIFTYQDSHNLITLGWIHTHPSQTAFMSSIDLHTHCSYQLMLPEAIAIVCAPKHSQTGMYSLTEEHGLKFIAACKLQGFHPHPKEPPIYKDSGHINLDGASSIVVADLR